MSRPSEEYRADFVGVARRALSGRPALLRVFEAYTAADGDALESLRALNINQGVFLRHLARVRRILSGAFVAVEPYKLFPPSEYFVRPARRAA